MYNDISYLAALLTAVVGMFLAFSVRRKNLADADESLTSSAKNVVDMLNIAIENLKAERVVLKLYIEYLLVGIDRLLEQLKAKKVTPLFIPKSVDTFRAE